MNMSVPGEENIFIIAEAGQGWRMGSPDRDLEMAKVLIEVAAGAGADAVKFQTFRAETLYVENAGQVIPLPRNGKQVPVKDMIAEYAMPYEIIPELARYTVSCDLSFMSTPFSIEDFEALDPYVKMHKIASYEISHLRLIEAVGRSGKPLILSTGASGEEDISWAVEAFYNAGGKDLVLMQCTASYPAPPDAMNLKVIPWLAGRFGVSVGLSDHSRNPLHAPLLALGLGARVIEKHFTLSNLLPGPDHEMALTPEELKTMVRYLRDAEPMLGQMVKEVLPQEKPLAQYARRGLQAVKDIRKGETLCEGINVSILRPGDQRLGLHPRHLIHMEGRNATRDIPKGDGIQEGDWII
jgi:N-acetylneuraminate synthase